MSRRTSTHALRSQQGSSLYSKPCCFCGLAIDEETLYGKIYEYNGIVTHYYCLLLSSNMEQKGEDDEGILGFLTEDIMKELRRGKRLVCSYCKKSGATLGCCNTRCKRIFHFPCGLKGGSLHQYFGEFRSYCVTHRPKQKIDERVKKEIEKMGEVMCYICYEVVNPYDNVGTLWAPCCRKNAWFHRKCVQQLASSAGYFFKCPLCNNKKEFQKAMKEFGIFIPSQDASWELVPNAFEELLYRHNRCDAKTCNCRKGRTYTNDNAWELVLCRLCGSQGIHKVCGKLKWLNPVWECPECIAILKKSGTAETPVDEEETEISQDSNDASDESDQNSSDSEISVGLDDTSSNALDNKNSTSLQNIKVRPGPRSFKLQQAAKAASCLTPVKKSSLSSEQLASSSAHEKLTEAMSRSRVPPLKVEKDTSESKPDESPEDIIMIESDDDVEIVSVQPAKIPVKNDEQRIACSTSQFTPKAVPFPSDDCVEVIETELASSSTTVPTINLDLSCNGIPYDSTCHPKTIDNMQRSAVKIGNEDLGDSVMNIRITHVTSLNPEVFKNVPDVSNISRNVVENYAAIDYSAISGSSLPGVNCVIESSVAPLNVDPAMNRDSSGKRKRNLAYAANENSLTSSDVQIVENPKKPRYSEPIQRSSTSSESATHSGDKTTPTHSAPIVPLLPSKTSVPPKSFNDGDTLRHAINESIRKHYRSEKSLLAEYVQSYRPSDDDMSNLNIPQRNQVQREPYDLRIDHNERGSFHSEVPVIRRVSEGNSTVPVIMRTSEGNPTVPVIMRATEGNSTVSVIRQSSEANSTVPLIRQASEGNSSHRGIFASANECMSNLIDCLIKTGTSNARSSASLPLIGNGVTPGGELIGRRNSDRELLTRKPETDSFRVNSVPHYIAVPQGISNDKLRSSPLIHSASQQNHSHLIPSNAPVLLLHPELALHPSMQIESVGRQIHQAERKMTTLLLNQSERQGVLQTQRKCKCALSRKDMIQNFIGSGRREDEILEESSAVETLHSTLRRPGSPQGITKSPCDRSRLIPERVRFRDLKFRVCGSNTVQVNLYDSFTINIVMNNTTERDVTDSEEDRRTVSAMSSPNESKREDTPLESDRDIVEDRLSSTADFTDPIKRERIITNNYAPVVDKGALKCLSEIDDNSARTCKTSDAYSANQKAAFRSNCNWSSELNVQDLGAVNICKSEGTQLADGVVVSPDEMCQCRDNRELDAQDDSKENMDPVALTSANDETEISDVMSDSYRDVDINFNVGRVSSNREKFSRENTENAIDRELENCEASPDERKPIGIEVDDETVTLNKVKVLANKTRVAEGLKVSIDLRRIQDLILANPYLFPKFIDDRLNISRRESDFKSLYKYKFEDDKMGEHRSRVKLLYFKSVSSDHLNYLNCTCFKCDLVHSKRRVSQSMQCLGDVTNVVDALNCNVKIWLEDVAMNCNKDCKKAIDSIDDGNDCTSRCDGRTTVKRNQAQIERRKCKRVKSTSIR